MSNLKLTKAQKRVLWALSMGKRIERWGWANAKYYYSPSLMQANPSRATISVLLRLNLVEDVLPEKGLVGVIRLTEAGKKEAKDLAAETREGDRAFSGTRNATTP